MSTISVGGKRLSSLELVFEGFRGKEIQRLRGKLYQGQSDEIRFISYDNSVPTMGTVKVRVGKDALLADKNKELLLDDVSINAKEPIVSPEITDLVFVMLPDYE